MNKNETIFLATTAIEEFWDTSRQIIFLGEWCLRYSRRHKWESLSHAIMTNPWNDKKQLRKAYLYTSQLYESYIPKFSSLMNELHGVSYSEKYWRIALGPWLFNYIHVLYDRFILIEKVLEEYHEFTTIIASEKSYVTPIDALDFVELVCDDAYNLQMFSKVLSFFMKGFPQKDILIKNNKQSLGKKNIIKVILRCFYDFFLKAGSIRVSNKYKIALYNAYFSKIDLLLLVWRTGIPLLSESDIIYNFNNLKPDREKRERLSEAIKKNITAHNNFETLLLLLMPFDMPLSYVEEYQSIRQFIKSNLPQNLKALISAAAWQYDDMFEQWAAQASEEGTTLIGIQHGGNYGSVEYIISEEHETKITDIYYTWGWDKPHSNNSIIPFLATKLCGRKERTGFTNHSKILFTTTNLPRYLYFIHTPLIQMNEFINSSMKFYSSLVADIQSQLSLRLFITDYGWDVEKRWRDSFPDIKIENWKIPFKKSLQNSRFLVCDHLATTFLEGISANIPTILFWNPDIYEIRLEAKPYYEELREVGILFDTPQEASKALNTIYSEDSEWWNSLKLQKVRRRFCNRFARTSDWSRDYWLKEFNQYQNIL